jgi:hypothetical protein
MSAMLRYIEVEGNNLRSFGGEGLNGEVFIGSKLGSLCVRWLEGIPAANGSFRTTGGKSFREMIRFAWNISSGL